MTEAFKERIECRWYKEKMVTMEQEELSMVWERKSGYKRQGLLDDKILLEKITHTCVIQCVAIKLILTWECLIPMV